MTEGMPGGPAWEAMHARLAGLEAQLLAQHHMLQEIRQSSSETRLLVGPCGIAVSADELLVQTLFGVKFYVPAADQLMTPQLVVYRQWEAKLSQLILHFAPAGSVFVDVGANLGYFTCLVAAKMGPTPGSRVIAIEPNPAMLRLLTINSRINWSMAPISVLPIALSDQPGVGALHIPARAAGNATLAPQAEAPSLRVPDASDAVAAIEVEIRRLDDVLSEEPRVDLLKVDVEGFEAAVFRGAAETLRRPGLRIVFEWAPKQLAAAGFQPAELLAIMREHGYRLFDADSYLSNPTLSERSDDALSEMAYGNLLALRDA